MKTERLTPAEEGEMAARADARASDWIFDDPICEDFTLNRIAAELQAWDTNLLITMAPFTHGDGNRLIRLTLADRGIRP